MGKARFELFAGISLALHGAVLAGAVAKRASAPVATSASAGTAAGSAAAVGGETFDVSEVADSPAADPGSDETPPIEIDQPAEPTEGVGQSAAAPREARVRRAVGHHAHAPAAPPSTPLPQYGAVGDRSAGDLVQTFKRVFPIAASSDPSWDQVPVGFYADGDVTFVLGEDGSLEHATASASSAAAFRAAIGRTTTLMKHRLFTAASPTTHLHMVLRVTSQLVNHGAFTIDAAGSFELPSGRHVSVTIAERVERGGRN